MKGKDAIEKGPPDIICCASTLHWGMHLTVCTAQM